MRPPRRHRRLLLVNAVLGAALALILAILWRHVHSEAFLERARIEIEARLSVALQRPVEVGSIRFSLWPSRVVVRGFKIYNPPGSRRPYLVAAEEIEARGDLSSLRRRVVDLTWVVARGAEFDLESFADGSTNLPKFPTDPKRRPIDLAIGRLSVERGHFYYNNHEVPMSFGLQEVNARLAPSGPGLQFAGTLSAARGTFELMDYNPISMAVAARLDVGEKRLSFAEVSLDGEQIHVRGHGEFEAPEYRNFQFDFEASADARLVDEVFKTSTGLAGIVESKAQLRGGSGGDFTLGGTWWAPEVLLPPRRFQDLAGDFEVTHEHVHVRVDRGRHAGGTFAGRFEMHDMRLPYATDLTVQGENLDLAAALADLGVPGSGLAGRGAIEFHQRFPVQDFESGSGEGTLRVAMVGALPQPPSSPAAVPAGNAAQPIPPADRGGGIRPIPVSGEIKFRTAAGVATLDSAQVRSRNSELDATGTLSLSTWAPDLQIDYRTRDLAELADLLDNFSAADDGVHGEFPRLAGSGQFRGRFFNSFSDIRLEGRAETTASAYEGIVFGDVAGEIAYRDGLVELGPFEARCAGERLRLTGSIAWGPLAAQRPDLDLEIDAERWPFEKVTSLWHLDLPFTGHATGAMRLAGEYEALNASGTLRLEDGTLLGEAYETLTGDLALRAGNLETNDLVVVFPAGEVRGEGTFNFASEEFTILAQGAGFDLARLGALAGLGGTLTGEADFNVSGYGTLDAPQLVVEASADDLKIDGEPLPEKARVYLTWRQEGVGLKADIGELLSLEGDVAFRGDTHFTGAFRFKSGKLEKLALGRLVESRIPISGGFEGELTVSGETNDFAGASVVGALSRVDLTLESRRLTNVEPVGFEIAGGVLRILSLHLQSDDSRFFLVGSAGLATPYPLNLNVQGTIDAVLLQYFVPRTQVDGELVLLATVRGNVEVPRISGLAEVRNGMFRFAGFPNGVEDIRGMVVFEGDRIVLDGLTGTVGGGQVTLGGEASLDRGGIGRYRLQVQGRDVGLRYPPGMRSRVDADLVLAGDLEKAALRGEVRVHSAAYTKDILTPGVTQMLVARRRRIEPALDTVWGRNVSLDVHIEAPGTISVRNNIARMKGSAELVLRGSFNNPLLFGRVEVEEGGQIEFRDVRYQVRSGTINFANPYRIDPVFDILATTRSRNYEIALNLSGTLQRITPIFTSDPPLSDLDIVSLLYFGKTAEEITGSGAAAGVSAASASSILAGAVFDQISKRGRTLFGLDRFQIDPFLVGPESNPTARITVGKQFSKDLSVTYSTNLASNQEQILVIEYQVSRDLFVVASREADGSYALDLRYQKRY